MYSRQYKKKKKNNKGTRERDIGEYINFFFFLNDVNTYHLYNFLKSHHLLRQNQN